MKFSKLEFNKFNTLILIGLIHPLASTGCRKKPGSLTPLPGSKAGAVKEPEPAPPVGPDIAKVGDDQIAKGLISNDPDSHKGWTENAELFKSDIVHFDFDSSVVKASEKAKVSNVADYLKGHSADAVRVEGNCDERGTEEYNRSLENAGRLRCVKSWCGWGSIPSVRTPSAMGKINQSIRAMTKLPGARIGGANSFCCPRQNNCP